MSRLMYIATSVLDDLMENVGDNLDRYLDSGFDDLVDKGNWSIETSVEVDLTRLESLDPSGGAEAEIGNSLKVWQALHALTPAMASENRIWTRLTHVECLEYSRTRWLKNKNREQCVSLIKNHFFASGITGCRDDNAISRLWWNAKVAKQLWPSNQKGALSLILRRADVRLNSLERSRMFSRPSVGAGVLRLMERDDWVKDPEENFRTFMKTLNKRGAGLLFEAMPDLEVDVFMNKCASEAKQIQTQTV